MQNVTVVYKSTGMQQRTQPEWPTGVAAEWLGALFWPVGPQRSHLHVLINLHNLINLRAAQSFP
jgi:hypothetical protein